MKIFEFFIDRPITSIVINLMLIICGLLAYQGLVVDEYPNISVPKLKVTTTYRNASALTVEKEITLPIEEALGQVEGVDRMLSESSSGESSVVLVFKNHISMDRALLAVNEQIGPIIKLLPKEADTPRVKRSGKEDSNILYLSVNSFEFSGADLTHFAKNHIKNYFQGIEGVAKTEVWGPSYHMKIDLDPVGLHNSRIAPHEIIKILKDNELLLQAGKLPTQEPISLDVVARNVQDYENLIVGNNHGAGVRLGDIANIRFTEDNKTMRVRVNNKNAVLVALAKASDGNVLKISRELKKRLSYVNQELLGRAVVEIDFDKSIFVTESLKTIQRTIIEACVLVILIIFLFLRQFRATLIPLVTIPISLIATFIVFKIFGLSINTITLLALVLSVGLVVDDAIVVLENIFRYKELGLNSYQAAKKGINEIGFAVIAMTMTLISVFLPLVFVSDVVGVLLSEFAIALAATVFFSGIVALTLSPLMCSYLLNKQTRENYFTRFIEKIIISFETGYEKLLRIFFKNKIWAYLCLIMFLVGGVYCYLKLESNLVPKEDRGIIGAWIPRMPGFDISEMDSYAAQVEEIFLGHKEIEKHILLTFPDGIQVIGTLRHWSKRNIHAEKLVDKIRKELSHIPSVDIWPWSWNIGLDALRDNDSGNAGVSFSLRTAQSYDKLDQVAQELLAKIREDSVLKEVRSDFDMNQKNILIKPKREALEVLGINESMISVALQVYSDRMHAGEYRFEGISYGVYVSTRDRLNDLESIYIKTGDNNMIPLGTVAQISSTINAPVLKHIDKLRALNISANLETGTSLSDAKIYLDKIITKIIPKDISVRHEGAIAMQKKSSNTFLLLFISGLVFIFAILAIQFEGIIDPLIIMLTVPLACIGGVFLLWISGNSTNIYTQVGMLTLVGLITKHGILLTEFVSHNYKKSKNLQEAVLQAAKLRFRPIIMTTAATVLGAVPLITSSGAGSESRAAIGLVIVGGMIFGTSLTLLVLPLIIYSIRMIISSSRAEI